MNDEHKEEGISRWDAVEYQHRLDSEMPWSGSVGGRNYHGNAADDERHQSAHDTEVAGGFEALECEIVVQEIAQPNAQGKDDEQGYVFDTFQGGNPLPQSLESSFHLIIYSQLLEQNMQQDEHCDATDGSDEIAGGGKLLQDALHARARFVEKIEEDRNLQKKDNACDDEHQQRVDDAFGYDRTQSLGKRNAIPALEDTAAGKLTDAGYHETQGI